MKNTAPNTTTSVKTSRLKRRMRAVFVFALRTFLCMTMLAFVLGGGAWLAVNKIINAQQISQAVTYQLQKVFDRPVVISSLDLKFLNTVELKGFAVLDSVVQPGAPVISAESVSIRYQLLPLLERKLIIDEVTLRSPRFEVLRAEDGQYSMPPVHLPQNSLVTYGSEKTKRQLQIHVEDWRVVDGVISYKDLKSGAAHAVYGLNMHFKKLHFNEFSPFRLETVVRNQWGGHISESEISAKGEVNFANFNWQRFALQDVKTRVSVLRKPVHLTLQMENLRTPSFSLQAQIPAFASQDLSVFEKNLPDFNVPEASLSVSGTLSESYNGLTLENATWKSKPLTVSAQGTFDFSAPGTALEVKAKTGWMEMSKLAAYYPAAARFALKGQGMAQATVSRRGGKYTLPQLELNVKKAGGSFWGFEAEDVSGQFIAKQNFSDLYAQTTDGHVQVANSAFDKLNLSASYRKGNVYAYFGSALLNDVPLKLRLSINDIKKDSRTIDTSIYLKELNPMGFIGTVQDFVEVILAIPETPSEPTPLQTGQLAWLRNFRDRLPTFMPNFSGTLTADTFSSAVLSGEGFEGEFTLTGMLPGAAELDGTLDMKLDKGVIHQMEKVAEEQEALNVTYTPFIMLHRMETSGSFKIGEVLKDVAVDEMAASVDFKKGTMIINNAFTQGPVISAAVSGWTDWARETFELTIWTMITPSSRRGILAENLTDENGNPALAFKVYSSMSKPKLEMLRAKKTNAQIQAAKKRGLRTEFKKSQDFVKGEFNAKK